jgi:biotin carboxyl carrier protein
MQRDIIINGKTIHVEVSGDRVTVNGEDVAIDSQLISPTELSLIFEGRAHRCLLDRTATDEAVVILGKRYPFTVEDPRALKSRKARGTAAGGPLDIKSNMPGRVLRIIASEGDDVSKGQGLLVVEAMKMQNEMKTPREGRVRRIAVKEGDTVNAGQLLAVVE